MQSKRSSVFASLFLITLLSAVPVTAQTGLTFTNHDSDVLYWLTAEGIAGGEQVDEGGQTIAALGSDGPLAANYPADAAELKATLLLDGGQDLYRFVGTAECAGLVQVQWQNRQGSAFEVLDARLVAAAAQADGDFRVQAVSTVTERTSVERLAVRGGDHYRIEISYALGADSKGRAATFSHFVETRVACDEIVTIDVEASDRGATVGASDYGPAPFDVEIPTRTPARDLLDTYVALPGQGHSKANASAAHVTPSQRGTVKAIDPGATSICSTDTFDGPAVDPVWTLGFIGDADQGSATIVDQTLYLSGDGTSLFHGTDNASFLQQTVTGDFRAEVTLIDRPINQGGSFRKGGLMVRRDNGNLAERVMVTLIFDHPTLNTTFLQFDYRDENGDAFEMASSPVDLDLPLDVAIDRRGDTFTVYVSTNNRQTWSRPAGGMAQGQVELDMGPTAEVGLAVASYDANTEYTVQFDDFELCQRQNLPRPEPPAGPGCQADRALDVIYVLDASGSMTAAFEGFPSKIEATADAIAQTNALIEANFEGSRSALITFSGSVASDPVFNLTQGAQIVAPITTDLSAVTAAAAAIDPAMIHPDSNTPAPIALDRTTQLLLDSTAPNLRRAIILLTDGAPNIDIHGQGASEYRFSEILPLSIRDGMGDFLRWDEVAWLGNYNGGIGTYDGEVFANTLYQIERMRNLVPDAQIFPVAIEGEDTYYEDLLAYASFYHQTPFLQVDDTTTLAEALQVIIESLDCGATIGDLVWNDINGDGIVDAGENPIEGVTVELRDETGAVIDTQVTDANGLYLFTDLPPGTYTITVVTSTLPPATNTPTYDLDGLATPNTTTVTVVERDQQLDVDFGYRADDSQTWCPRSPGYWKNHPESWPVDSLDLGGVTYDFAELMSFLNYGGPDSSTKLARALIAVKLNLASGSTADADLLQTVADADAFLASFPPGSKPKGKDKKAANALKDQLEAQYNGTECS